MSKIGDLWVNLGLKAQDLKKGLNDAKGELKKFSNESNKIFKNFANIASDAMMLVSAALFKLGKDALTTTQMIGDSFVKMTNSVKNSYRTLVGMVANGDFKNFFGRLKDSYYFGGQIAEAEDAFTEVMNGVKLRKAAIAEEQALLEEQVRNQNLSYKEREEAARKYLANIEELYKREEYAYKRIAEAYMDNILGKAGIYGANKYEYLRSFLENGATVGTFSTGDIVKDTGVYQRLKEQYDLLSNAEIEQLVTSIGNYDNSKAAFKSENKRINWMLNNLVAQGAKGDTNEASKALSEFMEKALSGALVDLEFDRETEAWLNLLGDPQTEAEAWVEELADAMEAEMSAWRDSLSTDDIAPIAFDFDAIDRMKQAVEELGAALRSSLVSALDELAYALAGVEDANAKTVLTAFLAPLADAAVQAGIIIMTTGEALEKLKSALANPFGTGATGAVIAGGALVAIGVAAKAGLVALSKGGSSASGTTTTSSGGTTPYESAMEITVKVEGKVKGNDIVLSGERALASMAR